MCVHGAQIARGPMGSWSLIPGSMADGNPLKVAKHVKDRLTTCSVYIIRAEGGEVWVIISSVIMAHIIQLTL